jgi:hypothetical protein
MLWDVTLRWVWDAIFDPPNDSNVRRTECFGCNFGYKKATPDHFCVGIFGEKRDDVS